MNNYIISLTEVFIFVVRHNYPDSIKEDPMNKKRGMRLSTLFLIIVDLAGAGYILYSYLQVTNQNLFEFIKALITKVSGS